MARGTMVGDERYVFPPELTVVPVASLRISAFPADLLPSSALAITRNQGVYPERIIEPEEADLLNEFRTPRTIVDGLLRYAARFQEQRDRILNSGLSFMRSAQRVGLIMQARALEGRPQPPVVLEEIVDGERVLQTLDRPNSIICKVRNQLGASSAFKLYKGDAKARADHEFFLLGECEGLPAPKPIRRGLWRGMEFVQMSWASGASLMSPDGKGAVSPRVTSTSPGGMAAFDRIDLAYRVMTLYASLFRRGIVHGEVHLRNLVVDLAGRVQLVDFAHAVSARRKSESPKGAADLSYYSADYVIRSIRGTKLCIPDEIDEQYAVASLVFHILTGQEYGEFCAAVKRGRATSPMAGGFLSPHNVQKMLSRPLSARREERYHTMDEFVTALMGTGPASLGSMRGATAAL